MILITIDRELFNEVFLKKQITVKTVKNHCALLKIFTVEATFM